VSANPAKENPKAPAIAPERTGGFEVVGEKPARCGGKRHRSRDDFRLPVLPAKDRDGERCDG
jgi:hypothetical protein